MNYTEYIPAQELNAYIDVYWVIETNALVKPFERHIYADGCTEIFINLGSSVPVLNGSIDLMPGNIYLGGTMTCAMVLTSMPNSRFVGIRFKPAGFAAFYGLPANEIVDRVIEFPDHNLMSIIGTDEGLSKRLDDFFIKKIVHEPLRLIAAVSAVKRCKGMVSVDVLAKGHNLTTRTLERLFMKEMGIPPKVFISIVKFMHASKRIQKNDQKDSLFRIAYEMGYYDHSHLTREIKKFSGLNPSEIGSVKYMH
jgi:AraC-like DNA-binding protein